MNYLVGYGPGRTPARLGRHSDGRALGAVPQPAIVTAVDGEARNNDAVGNTISTGSYNHRGDAYCVPRLVAQHRSRGTTRLGSGWGTTRARAKRNSRPSGWTITQWR